jgi:hypothetical protein
MNTITENANNTKKSTESKEQRLERIANERSVANVIRKAGQQSFVDYLGININEIIYHTRRQCNGRIIGDVAEKIGRSAGKVERITTDSKGNKKTIFVNDPLRGSLFGLCGILAGCGFAVGDIATTLIEQGIVSTNSILTGDGIEAMVVKARSINRSRSFLRILLNHEVITQDTFKRITEYKALKGVLVGRADSSEYDRILLGKATGTKVTSVMVQAVQKRLAELKAKTLADRASQPAKVDRKSFHKLSSLDFLSIINPVNSENPVNSPSPDVTSQDKFNNPSTALVESGKGNARKVRQSVAMSRGIYTAGLAPVPCIDSGTVAHFQAPGVFAGA